MGNLIHFVYKVLGKNQYKNVCVCGGGVGACASQYKTKLICFSKTKFKHLVV